MGKAGSPYDPRASAPMTAIVRVAVIAVTLALFFATSFNGLLGYRDIAIMLALATPLGISAWGFARAGHNEAAIALLCCVLITVVTIILVLNPLGVHDVAITAYGGIVLVERAAALAPRVLRDRGPHALRGDRRVPRRPHGQLAQRRRGAGRAGRNTSISS